MAFTHGTATRVYANGYDLTPFFKSASIEATREVAETTVFGSEQKTYIAGTKDATLSLEGFFDGAVNAVDPILSAALSASQSLWTVLLRGDANGNEAYGFEAHETTYSIESPVDDVVSVSAEAQSTVGPERVIVHHALAAETASGTGPAIDGGAATGNGGAAYLHLTAFSGFTSVDVVIEDSADGATGWATIATFANVTAAPAAQRVALTGTVRRWTRARWTYNGAGPGSGTFHVSFGRK